MAALRCPGPYTKQPWEEETLEVDFSDRIGTGDSLSQTFDVKVKDSTGADVSATMLGAATAISPYVYAVVKAGSDGSEYTLQMRLTTVNGEKIEDDLNIIVKEKP